MPQAIVLVLFTCLFVSDSHALRYEINAESGEIWALRESDKDTWEDLIYE